MSESPEEVLEILNELEYEARLAAAEYVDSLDPSTNVISIAPGSPARNMWEARMKLISMSSPTLKPLNSIICRARSAIFTGRPISRTKISPPSPSTLACSTSPTASGMVMK